MLLKKALVRIRRTRKLLLLPALVLMLVVIVTSSTYGAGYMGLLTEEVVGNGSVTSVQIVSMSGVADSLLYVCRYCMPNAPAVYNFGTLNQGQVSNTGLSHFTVQNYGEEAIDIAIRGTDATGTGTDWTLSDTATAGADTYGLVAGLSGDDYNIVVKKTSPYNNLVTGLAAGGSQDWGIEIYAPTSYSDWNAKTGNITLTASIS